MSNQLNRMRGIPFSIVAGLTLFTVVRRLRYLLGALALLSIWYNRRASS